MSKKNIKIRKTNSFGSFEIVSLVLFIVLFIVFITLITRVNELKEISKIKNNVENLIIKSEVFFHLTKEKEYNNDFGKISKEILINEVNNLAKNEILTTLYIDKSTSVPFLLDKIAMYFDIYEQKSNTNTTLGNESVGKMLESTIEALDKLSNRHFFYLKFLLVISIMIIGILIFLINVFRRNSVVQLSNINKQIFILAEGGFPKTNKSDYKGIIGQIEANLSSLSDSLRNASEFVLELGKGNYEIQLNIFNNRGLFKQSLEKTKIKLNENSVREHYRKFNNQSIQDINKVLTTYIDTKILCDQFLSIACKHTNGLHGCIYTIENIDNLQNLMLVSTYAIDLNNPYFIDLKTGEGAVGQCYKNKEIIVLKDIPENFYQINSSLGEVLPKNILFIPLKFNDNVLGVLEIAYLSDVKDYTTDFLVKTTESLAAVLKNLFSNESTKKLLNVANYQKEQLQTQEEELKQNMEEVLATQENLENKEKEKSEALGKLQNIHENMLSNYLYYNKIIDLAGRNRMLSQKISFNVILLSKDQSKSDFIIRQSILLHDKSFEILKNGGEIDYNGELIQILKFDDPNITETIEEVDQIWQPFKTAVNAFLLEIENKEEINYDNENLLFIENNSETLLMVNNKLVQKIVKHSKELIDL